MTDVLERPQAEAIEADPRKVALTQNWKTLARNKLVSAEMYIFYTLAKIVIDPRLVTPEQQTNKALDYLRQAFTPVSNPTKIANGRTSWDTPINTIGALIYGAEKWPYPTYYGTDTIDTLASKLQFELTADLKADIVQLLRLCGNNFLRGRYVDQ